jgi:ubiquinone/menaquinone biosynthesis C-methylase UbiE
VTEPGDTLRASYDRVAAAYGEHFGDELSGKPFDRALLDELAARAHGLVCDLGCGPGHVAHYLHQRGAHVLGVDISSGMIDEARRRYPQLHFEAGDMRSLSHDDHRFGAVVAMYSLIHFNESELSAALREIHRVLVPGGVLLASFHRGRASRHVDELLGQRVDLDFYFFEPDQIRRALTGAGFEIDRLLERGPYPDVEAQTDRFYLIARVHNTTSAEQMLSVR